MKLNTQSFLLILVLIFLACNKDGIEDEPVIDTSGPDIVTFDPNDPNWGGILSNSPDGQFINFNVDEDILIWIDNATQASTNGTAIESSMGTTILEDDPESVYFNFVVNATKGSSVIFSPSSTFQSISFSFYQKWAVDETTTNIDGCQMLPDGEFENIFDTGNWNPLERVCYEEMENKGMSMQISAKINEEQLVGTTANQSNCEEVSFDQTDSFFRITSFEKVENATEENRIQIEGVFNLKIYDEDEEEAITLEGGQFRFFMDECF